MKFEGAQVKKREVAKDLFAIAPLILDITRNKNILLIEYDFLILLHREWAEKLHFSHFFRRVVAKIMEKYVNISFMSYIIII